MERKDDFTINLLFGLPIFAGTIQPIASNQFRHSHCLIATLLQVFLQIHTSIRVSENLADRLEASSGYGTDRCESHERRERAVYAN